MDIDFIKQIPHFTTTKVPRYITSKIQECALNHLNLRDMGQLRDRMEGQMYYNKLRNSFLCEYAFENILSNSSFDWDKRMDKNYKRKPYSIEGFNINLITFSTNNYPKISLDHTSLCVMGRANEDSKVYLSGLATKELIKTNGINIRNQIFELRNFEQLIAFSTQQDLIVKIKKTAYNKMYSA